MRGICDGYVTDKACPPHRYNALYIGVVGDF